MKNDFKRLNDYYDKIYVISVEAAKNRRERFKQRFAGMEFTFFFGADKNNFSIKELADKKIYSEELTRKHHRYSKAMMPGEIACSWSHRMIYEEAIKNNFSRVLIFEDDALPEPESVKRINDIIDEIPADCELLMWGWDKNGKLGLDQFLKKAGYHLQHYFGLLKWDHTIIKNLFARPYSSHLRKAGFHDYAHAYGITKSAAQKLVQMQTPIQYIADNLLAHAITKNLVIGYIVYPPAFLHDNLPDGSARDSYIR